MRQYQPIWERLKKEKVVQVTANRRLHPRIIKAVTKEKWMDFAHKLELDNKVALMESFSKGAILTFRLTIKLAYVTEKDI